MKKSILFFAGLFISMLTFAQTPESFTYQAIVRDNSGQPLPNTSVTFQFNILQTSASGTIVYSEDQTATTNDFGLVNLQIGLGTVQSGSFSTIDWGSDAYFLNIQIDQGSGFVDMGTQQFISVPYAMYAKSAGNGGTTYTAGNGISITGNIIKNTAPDQIVNITGSGATTVTGTYPNFTVSSTDSVDDADADSTNELQTLSVTGNQLSISSSGGNTVTMQVAAAGNTGDVQFNNSGSLDADPDLHWDITNKKFTVGQSTDDGRMIIQQDPNASDSIPILEVKNKAGQTIFVVYPDSVHVFIDDDNTKGVLKGGFAVSGRSGTKASTNDYLLVRPDSTRISFNKSGAKGVLKGGFAVSGRSGTKSGVEEEYFNISPNDTASIISPSEARIMWYPVKNAFLAGQVLVNSADSVGTNSLSVGYETKAAGEYSQALGYKPMALGDNSTAIGNNANAEGNNSYAFGNYANTNAIGSYAIGSGANASGQYSFAVGSIGVDSAGNATSPTIAQGAYAYAFGMGAVALNQGDFALGTQDTASGGYALAMGYKTKASNYYSTSMGYQTTASGDNSTAMGEHTTASGDFSTAMGEQTTASGDNSTAMGEHTTASGDFSTAMGFQTTASEWGSIAMGYQDTASGLVSTVMGSRTIASGNSSTAMGEHTTASGDFSTAMGNNTTASGYISTAMGYFTNASRDYSTAIGHITTASGDNSTAMGSYTTASGNSSTSMGYQTSASGDNSTAMGSYTTASGNSSTSMGYQTTASGYYSTAMGNNTTAQSYASVVLGRYNIISGDTSSWIDTDPLFVIGNGDISIPHNAVTVLKNGNVGINTNIPDKLLTVDGNARVTGDIYYGAIGTGTTYTKPDFVFQPDYNKDFDILSIETFIKKHKHLPWVTAAKDEKDGINMTRMSFQTLEAVENQQLQIIELKKDNIEMKKENQALLKRIERLEKKLK